MSTCTSPICLRGRFGLLRERLHVAADADDEAVHEVADFVRRGVDFADDAIEELFDLVQVEIGIGLRGDDPGISGPAADGDRRLFGVDPLDRQLAGMLAFGGHPSDRVRADRFARGLLRPVLELLLRHLRPVGDHAGEVHRVVVARVVELERERLIAFDFLGDRFEIGHADAEHRDVDAVPGVGLARLLFAFFLELGEDLGEVHRLFVRRCEARDARKRVAGFVPRIQPR